MSLDPPQPAPARDTGMRILLFGMLAAAIVLSMFAWLTGPEAPPSPIDGVEVTLTDDNFQREVLDQPGFVLVDFWFEGCPPCRRMKPVVAHLSVNYRDRVKVGKLDVDAYNDTPLKLGLQAFPTLLLFHDGKLVARWDGYGGLKEMSRWLDEQIASAGSPGGA